MLGRISAASVKELEITGSTLTFATEWEGRSLHFQGRFDAMRVSGTVVYQPADGPSVAGEWRALKLDGSAVRGLPDPTGPYAVGRRTFHWTDTNREELSTAAPGDRRQLVAYAWYPVLGRRSMAVPYLPDAERMVEQLPRDSRDAVVRLTLNVADGPLPGSGRFPVVIFSPGAGVKALLYTSLQQELASHGFVVAALEHPYDVPVVVLPGGTEIVRCRETSDQPRISRASTRCGSWRSIAPRTFCPSSVCSDASIPHRSASFAGSLTCPASSSWVIRSAAWRRMRHATSIGLFVHV